MKTVVHILSILIASVIFYGCRQAGKGNGDGPVIITSRICVKNGCTEEFKSLAAPLIEATRQEKGCLRYELYRDASDSTVFFFYEVYADRAAQEFHSGSSYLDQFKRGREKLVRCPSEVDIYDTRKRN